MKNLRRSGDTLRRLAWLGVGVTGLLGAACYGFVGGDDPAAGGGSTTAGNPYDTAFPLARLTSSQYTATLHDLFAPVAVPDVSPPGDSPVGGFDNNTSAQTPSPVLIEAYHTGAVTVATAAMANPSALLGCSPSSRTDEDACAAKFIASFGQRAYRRPLSADDTTKLNAFYASMRSTGDDFPTAMTLTIEAMLQSPAFLYRVELGAPLAGSSITVQLDAWEMASRLSYLLWNTMPDAALFASAQSGELATVDGLDKQARRLLADPRAHEAVLNFHRQWLRFDKMATLTKDGTLFPTFNDATATSLRLSADKFVDGVFFGDGLLRTFLTDDHAWVDGELAPIYGVSAPQGSGLQLVQVDKTQRSGILTNAGLMAGFAHDTADSPVLRGVFVLDRILCSAPPPPPPNVPPAPAESAANPKTTRDRFAQLHEQGSCASCHHTIDGIGFGFEHYDATGKYRTTDMGFPVDATGWLSSGDLQGNFDGAVDLGQKLASSNTVQRCVTSQWMRYALGVDSSGIDPDKLKPVVDAFAQSGFNMRELVVSLVKSDAFRTRIVGP